MNIKIKLNYTQLISFSNYITDCIAQYAQTTYEQKTVVAIIIDWQAKKLMPIGWMHYEGTKTIRLSPSQACALVAIYQGTPYAIDNYIIPKVQQLITQIDSKIIK